MHRVHNASFSSDLHNLHGTHFSDGLQHLHTSGFRLKSQKKTAWLCCYALICFLFLSFTFIVIDLDIICVQLWQLVSPFVSRCDCLVTVYAVPSSILLHLFPGCWTLQVCDLYIWLIYCDIILCLYMDYNLQWLCCTCWHSSTILIYCHSCIIFIYPVSLILKHTWDLTVSFCWSHL